jgi:hypothetical protein
MSTPSLHYPRPSPQIIFVIYIFILTPFLGVFRHYQYYFRVPPTGTRTTVWEPLLWYFKKTYCLLSILKKDPTDYECVTFGGQGGLVSRLNQGL